MAASDAHEAPDRRQRGPQDVREEDGQEQEDACSLDYPYQGAAKVMRGRFYAEPRLLALADGLDAPLSHARLRDSP